DKILETNIKNNKQNTIIIGGNKEFIKNNNQKIKNYLNTKENYNIKIIDCYNVVEVGKDLKTIANQYDGMLNTSGEIAI
ncbi:MAG: hypothetical protein K6B70_01990, partial [Clostridia bacterium]|nr:hypothetical protein [Clostridia bacterium]